ncbi:MAG: (2Fe-2S)-binding protein, partial [Bacteroidetes bacterium]|nr:(2Fe-2S)-binding protein [Bacteroidota bacterium]
MVKITIDGKELEVDPKLTILQAAQQNGIHIPHFCWHPKLSVSGNCRMC